MGSRRALAGLIAFSCWSACGSDGPEGPVAVPPRQPPDIAPNAVPEIREFSASGERVRPRETNTLRWDVKNARTIEISDTDTTLLSTFDATGAIRTPPIRRDMTFHLRATNREHVTTAQVSISVDWEAPSIVTVGVSPNPVLLNSRARLDWETRNADTVRIEREGVEVFRAEVDQDTGHAVLDFTSVMTRIKFIAANPTATVAQELEVLAQPPPMITRFAIQPRVWLGGVQRGTLHWRTEYTEDLSLYYYDLPVGFDEEVPGFSGAREGSVEIEISSEGSYRLQAGSPLGFVVRQEFIRSAYEETEPNDTSAQPFYFETGARGRILTADDVDVYYTNIGDPLTGLRIYTIGVDGNSCGADTKITVRNELGEILGFASNGGATTIRGGDCAIVELSSEALAKARLISSLLYVTVEGENGDVGWYALLSDEL